MPVFKPGDQVTHTITQEEGVVKSLHIFRIGTNTGESLLVKVGKLDKVWLSEETTILDHSNRH